MPSANPMPDPSPSEPAVRSPSPPPLPPISLHPGVRATKFSDLYTKTLTHALEKISYGNFAACFPNVARQVPGSLAIMHGEMIARLRKFATDEFNVIIQERAVIPSLNALEDLLTTARRRKDSSPEESDPPIPPHTLPPETILSAHLTPHLISQQSTLNAKLQTVQSQNATLHQTIKDQEKEIEMLLRGLEGVVGDLEGAVGELNGVLGEGEGGVVNEMRAVEGEMSRI